MSIYNALALRVRILIQSLLVDPSKHNISSILNTRTSIHCYLIRLSGPGTSGKWPFPKIWKNSGSPQTRSFTHSFYFTWLQFSGCNTVGVLQSTVMLNFPWSLRWHFPQTCHSSSHGHQRVSSCCAGIQRD